jgi:hypothetical protein
MMPFSSMVTSDSTEVTAVSKQLVKREDSAATKMIIRQRKYIPASKVHTRRDQSINTRLTGSKPTKQASMVCSKTRDSRTRLCSNTRLYKIKTKAQTR